MNQIVSHKSCSFKKKLRTEENNSDSPRSPTKDFFYDEWLHYRTAATSPDPLLSDLFIAVLDSDLYAHIIHLLKQSQHLSLSETIAIGKNPPILTTADAEKPRVDAANVRKIIDFKPTPRHSRQIFLVQDKDGQEGYIPQAEFQKTEYGEERVPAFWDRFATPKQPDGGLGLNALHLRIPSITSTTLLSPELLTLGPTSPLSTTTMTKTSKPTSMDSENTIYATPPVRCTLRDEVKGLVPKLGARIGPLANLCLFAKVMAIVPISQSPLQNPPWRSRKSATTCALSECWRPSEDELPIRDIIVFPLKRFHPDLSFTQVRLGSCDRTAVMYLAELILRDAASWCLAYSLNNHGKIGQWMPKERESLSPDHPELPDIGKQWRQESFWVPDHVPKGFPLLRTDTMQQALDWQAALASSAAKSAAVTPSPFTTGLDV
ncbi:speckle-type POZ [Fusarium phyllophilum]|uniref:Speckle-type POZ n=1 Tax=Fusarium phyllophilum TaxID=47803 RepID=A0A8H5JZ93_9HYPO|nr:speckle-type POZ [Fusarium phyllophilum]